MESGLISLCLEDTLQLFIISENLPTQGEAVPPVSARSGLVHQKYRK